MSRARPLVELSLPDRFWNVHYNRSQFPGGSASVDLAAGANCQTFPYAVLRHFGRLIPNFRSSDLWHDREHTFVVTALETLDLVLFNRTREAFGAHVGVCFGEQILHLCRAIGRPTLWDLPQFAAQDRYRVLVGAKRTLN